MIFPAAPEGEVQAAYADEEEVMEKRNVRTKTASTAQTWRQARHDIALSSPAMGLHTVCVVLLKSRMDAPLCPVVSVHIFFVFVPNPFWKKGFHHLQSYQKVLIKV